MDVLFADIARELRAIYRVTRRPATQYKLGLLLDELDRTIAPEGCGPALVADLTTRGLTRWKNACCTGRSPNTVIGMLGYCRAVVSYAIEEGLLGRPPSWKRLRPKRVPRKRVRIHSADEMAALLSHLRGRAARSWQNRRDLALVGLVALAGLRASEAYYQPWADIHVESGWLEVYPNGDRELKNAESARAVPICPELRAIVEDWRPWVEPECPWYCAGVGQVRPWANGRPGHRPIDRLKAAARDAGIGYTTFQCLRASFGAHAASRWHCTDREIMHLMGHSSPETSRRHYDGTLPDNLRPIGRRIGYGPAA